MLDHLIEFFARTHLVVLHFPIALLIVAALIELSRALTPHVQRRAPAPFRSSSAAMPLIAIALLSTLYSVASGLVLGYGEPPKVDLHRILGIITGALVVALCVSMFIALRSTTRAPARVYLTLLLLCAIGVGYTGHLGGEITHGEGFLTRPLAAIIMPQSNKSAPIPVEEVMIDPSDYNMSQASLDLYLSTIQPILEDSCVECHGPEEAEEDVRLDTLEHLFDPDTEVLVRGDPIMSELYYRIDLPAGDPDIMPPEDESEPLSREHVLAIKAWIESLGE